MDEENFKLWFLAVFSLLGGIALLINIKASEIMQLIYAILLVILALLVSYLLYKLDQKTEGLLKTIFAVFLITLGTISLIHIYFMPSLNAKILFISLAWWLSGLFLAFL